MAPDRWNMARLLAQTMLNTMVFILWRYLEYRLWHRTICHSISWWPDRLVLTLAVCSLFHNTCTVWAASGAEKYHPSPVPCMLSSRGPGFGKTLQMWICLMQGTNLWLQVWRTSYGHVRVTSKDTFRTHVPSEMGVLPTLFRNMAQGEKYTIHFNTLKYIRNSSKKVVRETGLIGQSSMYYRPHSLR